MFYRVVGAESKSKVCCSANCSGFEQGKDTALGKKKVQEGMRLHRKKLFLPFPWKKNLDSRCSAQNQVEDREQYKILGRVEKLLVVSEKIHDILIGLIAVKLIETSILSYLSWDSIWEWFIDLNELSMNLRKIISTSFTKAQPRKLACSIINYPINKKNPNKNQQKNWNKLK